MIQKFIYLILLIVVVSCNRISNKRIITKEQKQTNSKTTSDKISEISTFDYHEFEIKRSQLGEIKIGMTISEAEQKIKGLRKEKSHASCYGYDGGSPAYLYYEQENLVFGLIPILNTDTILLIIAVSPKLTTTNGLSSNSKVEQIEDKYPNIKVNQDLMNGWEFISDTSNNWDFVFKTDEIKVGEYPILEIPSDLKNLDIKANWITIK